MEVSKFPRKTWGATHVQTVCTRRSLRFFERLGTRLLLLHLITVHAKSCCPVTPLNLAIVKAHEVLSYFSRLVYVNVCSFSIAINTWEYFGVWFRLVQVK